MHRVLVVEDDADIARLIELHLHDAGYEAEIVTEGGRAVARFAEARHDLVLLDRRLPDSDGVEVCRRLRAHSGGVPILMLTALTAVSERVAGLDSGADDYLGKPFAIPELLARVQALMRRSDTHERRPLVEDLHVPGLRIDLPRRRVFIADGEVALSAREFDLLCHLARHPGQVFTRAQLLDAVWGLERQAFEHTVDSYVNRLRRKIERKPDTPRYVQTVWGVGYRFADSH